MLISIMIILYDVLDHHTNHLYITRTLSHDYISDKNNMEPVATSIQNDMAIILSILITYPYDQILYRLHQSHILGTRKKRRAYHT